MIRKTNVQITIAGIDSSAALAPYILGFEHADDIERNADTITIKLANTDWRFLRDWWIAKGSEVGASILQSNWAAIGEGLKLDCGTFYVDEVTFEGPPNVCIVKATSIPVSGNFKNKGNQAFENSTVKDIITKLASDAGITVDYQAKTNPSIKRFDQDEESPGYAIKRLAERNGLMSKMDGKKKSLLIFDEADLDQQAPWIFFTVGVSPIIHYQLRTTSQKKVAGMLSSYMNPDTGQTTQDNFTPDTIPEGVDGADEEYDRPDYPAEGTE